MTSFFGSSAMRPSSSIASRSLRRATLLRMVSKLVSRPPSQRWLTQYMPVRLGGLAHGLLGLALGADEHHRTAGCRGQIAQVIERFA